MKAILVVDIPKEFENREPYFVQGSLFCYIKTAYGHYRYVCDLDKTKLKPLPQKKTILEIKDDDEDLYEVFQKKIDVGYNRCLDEIFE